jgi:glycosyltransferase involved in cell wall biosynthesis
LNNKKYNIWYLSAYDSPNGNSPRTMQFAKFFSKNGHNVSFLTNNFCHFQKIFIKDVNFLWREDFQNNIKVVWLKTSNYNDNLGHARIWNMWQNMYKTFVYGICCRERPAIIIAPSVPISLGFIGCLLSKILNCPMIYEIRDLWPEILADIGAIKKDNISFKIMRQMEKYIYKNCKAIVTTLPFIKDYIKSITKKVVILKYIPNGVEIKQKHTCLPKQQKSTKINKIMYFGGFGLDHDIETILEAAKILNLKHKSKYIFHLFGAGPKKSQMVKKAKIENISNVFFHNQVPKSKIPLKSKQSHLLIAAITNSPSYRFGINLNKILSYFICVKPILFSGNSPNNPVKESGAGLTVPAACPKKMAFAIKKILSMPAKKRLEMAVSGYNYAMNKLNIEYLGNEYLKLIHSLV